MTIDKIFKRFGIVSLVEAQQQTGISALTLKDRIQRGLLKGYKVGKTWLVLLKDISDHKDKR